MKDWSDDAPGVKRHIRAEDLPAPYSTESAKQFAKVVERPGDAWPVAPAGFKVTQFATGLDKPRAIIAAPNGDLFVTESEGNRVRVLRDADGDGKPEVNEIFVEKLEKPFGLAFYPAENPKWLYVANTGEIVRYPYTDGATKAGGKAEHIAKLDKGGLLAGGGHWTRDIVFSQDGRTLFASVGSKSNVDDDDAEKDRARILRFDPDGKNEAVYAWGIRNPVGLAIDPATGALWTSVNERDGLGDDLPPDYVTRVQEGGFYGWPWYYIGSNQDPRHKGKRPELAQKVIVPDVLIQSHSASLDLAFVTSEKFPARYRGIYAAQHGSWNREKRTGYKVVYIPLKNGKAEGTYEDFLTGFVGKSGQVWGRPVGVTEGKDGALYVTDDGSHTIWRVTPDKK